MTSLLLLIASAFFIYRRQLQYLRFFQQEEYDAKRFVHWLFQKRAFDRKGFSICSAGLLLAWLIPWPLFFFFSTACALIAVASFEKDPRKTGKILLKMTERATRIHRASFLLLSLWLGACFYFLNTFSFVFGIMFLFQFIPYSLVTANFFLNKKEEKLQKKFLHEAQEMYQRFHPYTIGITGSYGKTSTKDALGQILQIGLGPTFWPAKGVNTPMGITREIRTRLEEGYRYAVIEMAAYGRGSIERLCRLTPPQAAIITTIGAAHLERFKSEENIYKTKSELAEAVPYEGILVCNGDDPRARQIAAEHRKKTTLLYGFEKDLGPLDCWISSYQVGVKGVTFSLEFQGKKHQGSTRLFGKPALANAIAAFTMATALGCDPEYALAIISNLTPVDNRLQVRQEGGITYLHDAYNSNPKGFASALELAAALPSSRKIIMTPGMIELGQRQDIENETAAALAAQTCDLALVVGHTNRTSLIKGLQKGGFGTEQIMLCDTREAAFSHLNRLKREGDLILIENDLSDLYENRPKF